MLAQNIGIVCPKCKAEFPLTETLAQPLIDAERARLRQEEEERNAVLRKREQDLVQRRDALDDLEKQLTEQQKTIEAAVEQRLGAERDSVRNTAEKKVAAKFELRLAAAEQEIADKDKRLADAEQAELALRRARKTLEDEKRKLELEVERRMHEERLRIRELTLKEEDENHRLKLAERDKIIADMQRQIEDLRRKSDQGSQQLQGEVQELEIESVLKTDFPSDRVEPVQKGRAGGDVLQIVFGPSGIECGKILWESKRTKTWSNEWLAKIRQDQRSSGCQIGVIVTTSMPRSVDTFDRLEGVWVVSMRCMRPLAKALRLGLIEAGLIKSAAQGRGGKMDRVYGYLTGAQFRARVSAIVEACAGMQKDDDAEKRILNKYWAKRQSRIELLVNETVSVWGDLQVFVDKGMGELPGLTLPSSENRSTREVPNEPDDNDNRKEEGSRE